MHGYTNSSYGDGFADVYDEWYGDVSPVEVTVDTLCSFVPADGRVVELGVGTGRLALPLARAITARRACLTGIDASPAMLAVLRERRADEPVDLVCGDMVDDVPQGPFHLAFAAYNTFFNLLSEERQRAAMAAVACRLAADGVFVVEAFVPNPDDTPSSVVEVRHLAVDRVVLSVSISNVANQVAEGQFVEFTETTGVRLRPWSIRWATVAQLDQMAGDAGLALQHRWADFARSPFDSSCRRHVSVYARQ
jgi:SAM-dependent methyltransferase